MSFAVFLWVLAAALLHASWNAMVKTGGNKAAGLAMVALFDGAIGLAVVMWRPLPGPEVWGWLVASGLVRTFYLLFLGYAYEHGDLSRVYPIARGAAPLFVLMVGGLFLSDVISPTEVVGILVLGTGILLMARGAFFNGERRRLVPFALGSAVATASYSIVDGIGARLSGDPVTFVGWALALTGIFYIPTALVLNGPRIFRADRGAWLTGGFAGIASYLAYTIVVWAMTQAPIALVTALRETSILFAVLIGWLIFSERMDRGKALAAVLIVSGAALTRL